MTVDSTRDVMTRYFDSEHSDVNMMADDVVLPSWLPDRNIAPRRA